PFPELAGGSGAAGRSQNGPGHHRGVSLRRPEGSSVYGVSFGTFEGNVSAHRISHLRVPGGGTAGGGKDSPADRPGRRNRDHTGHQLFGVGNPADRKDAPGPHQTLRHGCKPQELPGAGCDGDPLDASGAGPGQTAPGRDARAAQGAESRTGEGGKAAQSTPGTPGCGQAADGVGPAAKGRVGAGGVAAGETEFAGGTGAGRGGPSKEKGGGGAAPSPHPGGVGRAAKAGGGAE